MSNLQLTKSISPTLSRIVFATALSSACIAANANANLMHNSEINYTGGYQINFGKTSHTSSSFLLTNDLEAYMVDDLMLQIFENISKDSKPLDEKFARILSENLLDLF
ncbi:hypothetical protein [Acinetobacter guillouiae]|uniref:hypothetical protein n=1 Tax=Acinetobacter guillouiae TaxID=106649 RepID=UPI00125FF371|nr:hypothetical protein [Acinetobacter guillouiae]